MFVIDRLLLALSAVIFPDPGMERVFIHAKIARCLSKRLLRLDREFDCAFLKFSGILWRRGLTHRTHLICGVVSVSPCVRKSIATSGKHWWQVEVRQNWRRGRASPVMLAHRFQQGDRIF